MISCRLRLVDEDAGRLRIVPGPVAQRREDAVVVPSLDPATKRRDRNLIARPSEHGGEALLLPECRVAADRVCPIEQREERFRIESLVVDRPEGTGSLQELRCGTVLSGTDRLGEAEARGGAEQIARRLVGQRALHDPMSRCA